MVDPGAVEPTEGPAEGRLPGQRARWLQNLLLLLVSTSLCLLVLEGALRWLEPPRHDDALPQGHFQQHSKALGWDGKPGSEGAYAVGHCYGRVTIDEHGNRRNAAAGTFRPGDETILFIGDSNTAALEVDDEQTIPAVLEQTLRQRGSAVNVVNLGVRAYGTDQSVRKTLLQAERLQPRQIVYLYSDNDFYDNNIVRLIPGSQGKGAYLRNEAGEFVPYNYPVPRYSREFYSAVLVDPEGRSVRYEGDLPAPTEAPPGAVGRLGQRLEAASRLYSALSELRRTVFPSSEIETKWRAWQDQRADPYELMQDPRYDAYDVYITLFHGLVDGGALRHRHREYYEAQFAHLLGLLREIPSLERLHLVEFVSEATLELLKRGEVSTNQQLFTRLLGAGLIDSYVNLNEIVRAEGLRPTALTCGSDSHFNAEGDRWAAEAILERVEFD